MATVRQARLDRLKSHHDVREVLEHTILDDRHVAAGRTLIVDADANPGFAVEPATGLSRRARKSVIDGQEPLASV